MMPTEPGTPKTARPRAVIATACAGMAMDTNVARVPVAVE